MNSEQLFSIALGLQHPWKVSALKFRENIEGGIELHIDIGFEKGSKFPDPSGILCPVYDTMPRIWQHLNFFQHLCFLHCNVPRIKDQSSGKVRQVEVPWARQGSGFTLLFEAFAMALIEREMPINKVAGLLQVYPQRIWTIFN